MPKRGTAECVLEARVSFSVRESRSTRSCTRASNGEVGSQKGRDDTLGRVQPNAAVAAVMVVGGAAWNVSLESYCAAVGRRCGTTAAKAVPPTPAPAPATMAKDCNRRFAMTSSGLEGGGPSTKPADLRLCTQTGYQLVWQLVDRALTNKLKIFRLFY